MHTHNTTEILRNEGKQGIFCLTTYIAVELSEEAGGAVLQISEVW